jgi:hypothetical protein
MQKKIQYNSTKPRTLQNEIIVAMPPQSWQQVTPNDPTLLTAFPKLLKKTYFLPGPLQQNILEDTTGFI